MDKMPDLPKGIVAMFGGKIHGPGCTCHSRNPTIAAHYGVADNASAHMEREMFIDMLRNSELHKVIDKNFGEMTNEQRNKVFVFAEAYRQWREKKIELLPADEEIDDDDLDEDDDSEEEEDDDFTDDIDEP